jgi:hypothetical protein
LAPKSWLAFDTGSETDTHSPYGEITDDLSPLAEVKALKALTASVDGATKDFT